MQTNCPNCSNRLVVDDAKVPPTPFMLKCPKCQGMVKLPGRSGAAAAPPPPPPSAARPVAPPPTPPPRPAPVPAASAPAPTPSPVSPIAAVAPPVSAPAPPPTAGKALVSFPSADQAAAIAGALSRLGFAVDHLDAGDDRLLRLQQGEYAIVASARNGVPDDRNAYRIVQTLAPEIRRRVFLVLVGDELQTGEGVQAFALMADLVLHSRDAAQCDRLLAQSIHERRRVYQTYWDAEDRKLEGKL